MSGATWSPDYKSGGIDPDSIKGATRKFLREMDPKAKLQYEDGYRDGVQFERHRSDLCLAQYERSLDAMRAALVDVESRLAGMGLPDPAGDDREHNVRWVIRNVLDQKESGKEGT